MIRRNSLTVAGAAPGLFVDKSCQKRTDFPFNPHCGHLHAAYHIFERINWQQLKVRMVKCESNGSHWIPRASQHQLSRKLKQPVILGVIAGNRISES